MNEKLERKEDVDTLVSLRNKGKRMSSDFPSLILKKAGTEHTPSLL